MVEGRRAADLIDQLQAVFERLLRVVEECASFVVPVGPPSALAPLSEMTMISVFSSSPLPFRNSGRRPTW
jgi:hypothetical protein